MTSDLQRATARRTAAATFTKYPRWFDSATETWRPLSDHPLYDLARKQPWAREEAKYLPADQRAQMPELWTEGDGWLDLLRFIEVYLPSRPPDHRLYTARHADGGPLFYWRYARPLNRGTLYGSASARAAFERYSGAPERTHFEPLPMGYFDAHPPRRPAWEEAGFVMPEGGPERYVCAWPFYDVRSHWQID